MVKRHLTLNVEDDLIEKAKGNFLNISEIAEKAIKEKLGQQEVVMDITVEECEFCGKKEEKATATNLEGLTWHWPDERWICNSCLGDKKRRVNAN